MYHLWSSRHRDVFKYIRALHNTLLKIGESYPIVFITHYPTLRTIVLKCQLSVERKVFVRNRLMFKLTLNSSVTMAFCVDSYDWTILLLNLVVSIVVLVISFIIILSPVYCVSLILLWCVIFHECICFYFTVSESDIIKLPKRPSGILYDFI